MLAFAIKFAFWIVVLFWILYFVLGNVKSRWKWKKTVTHPAYYFILCQYLILSFCIFFIFWIFELWTYFRIGLRNRNAGVNGPVHILFVRGQAVHAIHRREAFNRGMPLVQNLQRNLTTILNFDLAKQKSKKKLFGCAHNHKYTYVYRKQAPGRSPDLLPHESLAAMLANQLSTNPDFIPPMKPGPCFKIVSFLHFEFL